jgi:hypothetical protein
MAEVTVTRPAWRGSAAAAGRVAAVLALLTAALGSACAGPAAAAPAAAAAAATAQPSTIHVAAGAMGGDGSGAAPFGTLPEALAAAGPGDTVLVGPGTYAGKVRTVRSGAPGAPIRIVGDGAHLYHDGTGRLVEIAHDHISVEGFELSDANILVVVVGARFVRVERNFLHGAASECLRLRYFAQSNEIFSNVIRDCGTARSGANGEAVYVGTAPERLDENPTSEPDFSGGNVIRGNDVVVWGECVDIKEAADANLVVNNWCRGSTYVEGAALSTRARWTGFFNNWAEGNLGSGLQLSGDRPGDGTSTWVVNNTLVGNGEYGLKVVGSAWPQHLMCGNVLDGNGRGPATPAGAGADQPC